MQYVYLLEWICIYANQKMFIYRLYHKSIMLSYDVASWSEITSCNKIYGSKLTKRKCSIERIFLILQNRRFILDEQ